MCNPFITSSARTFIVVLGLALALGACTSSESSADGARTEEVSMEPITGSWGGEITVQGQSLPLVFHIREGADGLFAVMDSPAQNATGLPVDQVRFDGATLELDMAGLGASYEGAINQAGDTITGVFRQGGLELDLVLAPVDDGSSDAVAPAVAAPASEVAESAAANPESARRPQHPEPPYPYVSEDVRFTNPDAGIELAGTVTRPEGDGPFPAVILISGSGQQNRDEEIFGHRPFLVLADALTRAGVAVLRYDDRGVGGSGGSDTLATATSDDFAGDAAAALRFLRAQPYVAADRAGVLGHSEGGLIAALMASGTVSVSEQEPPSFVVFMAAAAVPGDEVLMMQSRAILEAGGASPASIEQIAAANRKVYDTVLSDTPREEAAEDVARILGELGMTAEQIEVQRQALFSPWFRFFLRTDPRPALRAIDVPVLAVFGTLDRQVPSGPNAAAMRDALAEAPTTDVTVRELEGLNHLMQPAQTGGVEEYGRIETTIAPEALELMTGWVAGR